MVVLVVVVVVIVDGVVEMESIDDMVSVFFCKFI